MSRSGYIPYDSSVYLKRVRSGFCGDLSAHARLAFWFGICSRRGALHGHGCRLLAEVWLVCSVRSDERASAGLCLLRILNELAHILQYRGYPVLYRLDVFSSVLAAVLDILLLFVAPHGAYCLWCYILVRALFHPIVFLFSSSYFLFYFILQRLHMDAIGHPILGDHFYGTKDSLELADRCLLHAKTLCLRHPITGERRMFTAPCDF